MQKKWGSVLESPLRFIRGVVRVIHAIFGYDGQTAVYRCFRGSDKMNCQNVLMTVFIFCFCSLAHADPWFTGPIIAQPGITVGLGHAAFETYGFLTNNSGTFDQHGKVIPIPTIHTYQANPQLTYGLADDVDVQWSVPYSVRESAGISGHHLDDTSVMLGFQAHSQKPGSWVPNLRVTIQEVFPTGRFDNLNPTNQSTGATGSGSYENILTLNFQDLWHMSDTHYLRTRLCFSYLYAHPTTLEGISSYGGTLSTQGVIKPGNASSIDLAGEFTVTQNWVAVMEAYYVHRLPSSFKGTVGLDERGLLGVVGNREVVETTLAPAIEYNFNANYGIIAGVWLSVKGKNGPSFTSTVIAFNAYW